MAKKEFKKEDEQLQQVDAALSNTGKWIEEHSKMLMIAVAAVVLIVLGVILANNYICKPKAIEASNENAKANVYFAQGEWEKALNGDDNECIGFEAIANEYKLYQQGKLAALYAGVCYYKLGDYENAKTMLSKFSASDLMIDPAANILLGDTYVQLQDYAKAVKAFEAAAASKNELLAPISLKKAGFVYLEMGNKSAAKKAFETIKNDYPQAQEAQDIDKYIVIAQ